MAPVGLIRLLAISGLLLLAGCVVTPYGPLDSGGPGGYMEKELAPRTWRVEFRSNRHTSEEITWNYWMYRCAELTKSKGFEYFHLTVEHKTKSSALDMPHLKQAAFFTTGKNASASQEYRFIQTGGSRPSPYFYYYSTPGMVNPPAASYWANGILRMYKNEADLPPELPVLNASSILSSLDKYVKSAGSAAAPDRKSMLDNATYVRSPSAKDI